MIQTIENYLVQLFPNATFGQIAEENSLINFNIYDTGNTPFFNDDKTHLFSVSLFIREVSFSDMQNTNESVNNKLIKIYDVDVSNIHIVDTKKTGSQDPFRDDKNRYGIYSTFEMLVEEV